MDKKKFQNRGMDMDTEFFENRGVDMDTAWNRCPPNSASGCHFNKSFLIE